MRNRGRFQIGGWLVVLLVEVLFLEGEVGVEAADDVFEKSVGVHLK